MPSFLYDPADYDRLTTLSQAIKNLDNSDSQAVLDSDICALFEAHDVANVFGISLLHRHFDMASDEILVEHGPSSTPWQLPPEPSNFMDGSIVPRSWHFLTDSDEPHPYEFGFQRYPDSNQLSAGPISHADFIADLHQVLKRHALTDILGLVALGSDYLRDDKGDFIKCEKTFGRANVVFDVGSEALNHKDKRTSIWTFGRGVRAGRESMFCLSGCVCSSKD